MSDSMRPVTVAPKKKPAPAPVPADAMTNGDIGQPEASLSHADMVGALMLEAESYFHRSLRALAAYRSLYGAYASNTGQLAAGERKQGMPIFEFSASLDSGKESREKFDCVVDLKGIKPEHVPYVLVPMLEMLGNDLLCDLQESQKLLQRAQTSLVTLLTPPAKGE